MTPALHPIRADEADALARALTDYLSEMAIGPLPDSGTLARHHLAPGRVALWLRTDRIVGFALAFAEDGRHELAEFTIAPSERRRGQGRACAMAVFARHPGPWRLGVVDRAPARAFWDSVLPADPRIRDLELLPPLTPHQVHAWRFTRTDPKGPDA